jgi:hypothetical protein
MEITIIAEEELTHKVLADFEDDFAISFLGRSLDVLLNSQGVIIQLLEDVFPTGHGNKSTKTLNNGYGGFGRARRKRT